MKRILLSAIFLAASYLSALDLAESIQIALQNNLQLKSQEESLKAAQADEWSSYLGLGPSASLGMNYNDSDANFDGENFTNSLSLQVNQPLFNGGKIFLGAMINRDLQQIEAQNILVKRLEIIAETEKKYFAVLENEELVNIARQNLEAAESNFQKGEVRFESGSISKVELLQLQSDLASKEVNLMQSQNSLAILKQDLQNYLQLDKLPQLQSIDFEQYAALIEKLKNLKSIDPLFSQLLLLVEQQNPALQISALSKSTSKKGVWLAAGNFLPTLNLSYSKNWIDSDNPMSLQDYDSNQSIGLNISVPVFPLADNGLQLAKANYQLRRSGYQAASTKDGIELALRNAIYQMLSNAKLIESARLAFQYAEESYQQMSERFDSGLITTNDLLASRVMLASAQNQYTRAKYNFLKSQTAILQQLGTDDRKTLEKILMGE
ncbi:MAG: TolC family protein [Candidatus Cloacimonadales bacterium]